MKTTVFKTSGLSPKETQRGQNYHGLLLFTVYFSAICYPIAILTQMLLKHFSVIIFHYSSRIFPLYWKNSIRSKEKYFSYLSLSQVSSLVSGNVTWLTDHSSHHLSDCLFETSLAHVDINHFALGQLQN